jgi:hypothetical protein
MGSRFKRGNYKRTFIDEVDRLTARDLPVQVRLKVVDDLIEAYFTQTGEIPDSNQLTRLADYLLKDELTDRHPDKVTRTEFPILSGDQQRLRGRRERARDTSRMTNDTKHRLNGRRKNVPASPRNAG